MGRTTFSQSLRAGGAETEFGPEDDACPAPEPPPGPDSCDELVWRPTPIWKRSLDLVVAVPLLVALSPICLLITAWIRLVSRGPILFTQARLGGRGRYFVIYKFRTMRHRDGLGSTQTHRQYVAQLAQEERAVAKPDHGSRLIPGGGFLRRYSLDELPQLLNVLRGNMSLVGPRPDVLDWSDHPPWQRRRFEVTPGITGLWQVSGKNRLSFQRMVELDLEYIQKRSLALDLWILAKTFRVVVASDNE